MRLSLILITILTIGCTKAKDDNDAYFPEQTLGEQFDSKGRLTKKVVAGRIPGEDTYLTITKYDSTAKVTEEYGARPYGEKFRTAFNYNSDNQVIEVLSYTFLSGDEFENYQSDRLYELADTSVSYDGTVNFKSSFTYDLHDSLLIERQYHLTYDSITNKAGFELSGIDTVDMKENER